MTALTCPACGTSAGATDVFCGACGSAIARTAATSAPIPSINVYSPGSPAPAIDTAAPIPEAATPAQPTIPSSPICIPAGFWNRLVAWLIDFAILATIGLLFTLPSGANLYSAAFAAVSILSIVYRPLLWRYRNGQTIGQQAMKIRALKNDGTNLDLGRGVWRVLATWITGFIPFVGRLNVLSMLWNHERRCWFDRWSDTRVDAIVDPRLFGFFTRD